MRQQDNSGTLFMLAGVGLLVYAFWPRNPPQPPPPNGNGGNGNGGPTGGLRLDNVTNPQFIASGERGVEIAAPGGVLRINLARIVATNNNIAVTNTHPNTIKYLNARMELIRPIQGFPDQVWLRHEPGRGFTANVPGATGLGTFSLPSVQGIPVSPGQTRQQAVGVQVDGPGVSQSTSTFWAPYDNQIFRYKLSVLETDSPGAVSGKVLGSFEWNPAFTTDLVVLAQDAVWRQVPFGQDTVVDAVAYGNSPNAPLIRLPQPTRVQDLLRAIEIDQDRRF